MYMYSAAGCGSKDETKVVQEIERNARNLNLPPLSHRVNHYTLSEELHPINYSMHKSKFIYGINAIYYSVW